MAVLVLKKLVLTAKEQTLLQGISFDLEAGQILAVVGPGGSGKSSLLKSVFGAEVMNAGSILIDGCDVSNLSPSQRKTVMLTQSLALFSHLSLRKNILIGRRTDDDKTSDALVDRLLERFEITECADLKPHQLSHSQQQKAALVRTLSSDARVYLFDEPTTHLDLRARMVFLDCLRDLSKRRKAIVLIATQDLDLAFQTADQVAVLDEGSILQKDTPIQVYRRPIHPQVASFISASSLLDGQIVRAEAGMLLVETALGSLCGVSGDPDADYEEKEAVILAIRPEAIRWERMAPEENAFPVTPRTARFRGDSALVELESNGVEIWMSLPNPASMDQIMGSTEMYAWVDTEDVVVMKRA